MLIAEDDKIIDFLKTYGQVRKVSLEALFSNLRINRLIQKGIAVEECGMIKLKGCYEPGQSNMHYAVDLLVNLKDNVTFHTLNQHPFLMFLIMNDKPYDVAVIEPGSEAIYKNLIERSSAENVIAIVSETSQAENLKTSKNMTFCILHPFKLFKLKG